ncbi:restriction endonuclease subunit S [Geothermobacter hydrogeniphilus]|uniref:Restriction endonuclease subunit S n=1 Tax=Geothermobacter hydrogeniphilus TaxID=1969733 RepID=A0A2K2HEB6_9BACT|nr:restriction endonuclease subunit S [Geothermobacter hydrogeniphilus]PNU21645.1 restriction endonuclease subunit S [Geothermobacter hydrogeniphilus]
MNWNTYKISEITEVVTKGTTPTTLKMNYAESGVPFLRAQNLQNGTVVLDDDTLFIDTETHKSLSRSMIRPNDVLVSIAGTIGRTALVPEGMQEMNCNQAVAIVRPNTKVDSRYLAKWLNSRGAESQILGKKVTATIANLSLSQIKSLELPLPPLPEQRRIAAILDKADAIRRKRQQAIRLAEEFLRSVFLDMFGDPVLNPKGWKTERMGDVCDVRDGTHDSPKYVENGGRALVTSKNLSAGNLDLTNVNYISEDDYVQICRRSKVDIGDILMPMIGTIGSPVLIEEKPDFAIKNVALIKFKEGSPEAIYVLNVLRSHYFKHIVNKTSRGGTQKFISLGDLRSFPLRIPPNNIQLEFSRRVRSVEGLKIKLEKTAEKDNYFFNALVQRAFRGEL